MSTSSLWVAYGSEGSVVGSIRKSGDEYIVTMAGAEAALGAYPSMDIAKNALHGHLPAGAEWPQFREH